MSIRIRGVVWIMAIIWGVSGCASMLGTGRYFDPMVGDVLTPISKESRVRTDPRADLIVMATYEELCEGLNIGVILKAKEEPIPTNVQGRLFGGLQGTGARQHLSLSALEVRFGDVAVNAPQAALWMFKEPYLGTLSCKRLPHGGLMLSIRGGDGGEGYIARFFYSGSRLLRVEAWQRGPTVKYRVKHVWRADG